MYLFGPCSAESREQVIDTARQIISVLGKERPFIFRAGVWKPRTSPNTFQGAGEEALGWLQEVKRTFKVPVATEVATPEHVEAALNADIDYLWIGARTSANPIAVQAIADAIKEKGERLKVKGLLIKNPVNQDADLWLGNIERLERTGVPVMVIHRGCGHQPCWSMAHKVRTARPDVPMLLDPSHLSGDAEKVPTLLHKVEELGLDGAMIEVHCAPEKALSDRKQQIRPEVLRMMEGKPLRNLQGISKESLRVDRLKEGYTLNWLRAEIDELDDALWETIAARMDVSRRIGAWKKEHGVTPLQPERYQQIVEKIKAKGARLEAQEGLNTDFMLRIWDIIHEESLRQQH